MSKDAIYESVKSSVLPWQQGVIAQLLELKHQDKLPHAILLENRTGSDCSSLGWYLIQTLLCESITESKPCGICSSCTLMQSNNYPDFTYTTIIEDEKTHKLNKFIRIGQIRKLIHQITLTDNLGNGKYALIYPAEKMHISASNSLLKTLEEPPMGSTLILLSHNPGKLPITVRSRCQKWVFDRPDLDLAEKWLIEQGVEKDKSLEYLSAARNDVEFALQLHDQNYDQNQSQISEKLNSFLTGDLAVTVVVKDLESVDRELMKLILKLELNEIIQSEIQKEQGSFSKSKLSKLLDLYQVIEKSMNIEENNLNLRLLLEDMLISMKQILNRG